MMQTMKPTRLRQKGVAIIGVLIFILITTILLAGVGTYAVSHQTRADVDMRYAAALDLAEAGVNFELRRISQDTALADNCPGTARNLGEGTFTVYCANRDGSTPWTPPDYLDIISTGTIDGVSRTVRASVKGYMADGNYAIYTMEGTSFWNGSAISIVGDIGTNGYFDFSGHPGISGSVYFNGPNAGWADGDDPGGYNVIRRPGRRDYPTVAEKALEMFPNSGSTAPGGLAYLATNNDNARAIPPIVNNSITNSVTLVGPGNYYVTNINLTGNKKITFDNTLGPINLWIGPPNGTGTARFRGGTAAISATSDPSKACQIFVATQSGIDLAGNERIDATIHAYNVDGNGNAYGYVLNSGNPTIYGQIIANRADINGNLTVNYVPGTIVPQNYSYYGFDDLWVEMNGR